MIFISFVGTQAMAVWNALYVLDPMPTKVFLLATNESKVFAKRLKNEIAKQGLKKTQIDIISSADRDEAEGKFGSASKSTQDAFLKILNETGDTPVAFNVAGGLNFQIAACMVGISKEQLRRFSVLYPERTCVHVIRFGTSGLPEHSTRPLPDPIQFLRLQGFWYDEIQGDDTIKRSHGILKRELRTAEAKLPVGFKAIKLRDVTFHAFWNQGNQLMLVKVIDSKVMRSAGLDPLGEISSLVGLATSRDETADLYHRQIALLTDQTVVAEHARNTMGKITLFHYGPGGEENARRGQRLKAFLGADTSGVVIEPPKPTEAVFQTTNGFVKERALVVILGPNATPTLAAISSHKPEHALVLYTPGNPDVERCVDAMGRKGSSLPIKKITFYPIDFLGSDILKIPKPTQEQIQCNMTPGTKSQKIFMSLWASAQRAECYSIFTEGNAMTPLGGLGSDIPISAPSPVDLLELTGLKLASRGKDILGNSRKHVIEAIFDFLKSGVKENLDLSMFPFLPHELNCRDLTVSGEQAHLFRSGRKFKWSVKDGLWIQELVALAMEKCGAKDVRYGVQVAHDEKIEKYLTEKFNLRHHERPFLADLDVVARLNADHYVVECKSDDILKDGYPSRSGQRSLDDIETRVNAQAALMGRFATPLIFSLRYPGDPKPCKRRGYVFGHKTLVDKDALAALMRDSVVKQRKTVG